MKEKRKVNLSPTPISGDFPSMLLGLIAVLITFTILQKSTIARHSSFMPRNHQSKSETEIQWQTKHLPENQLKPIYVEANPNVPENPPDEVKQFSFRDQQAAQRVIKERTNEQKVPKINGTDNNPKIIETSKNPPITNTYPPPALTIQNRQNKDSAVVPKTSTLSKAKVEKQKSKKGIFSIKNLTEGQDKEKTIIARLENPSLPSSSIKVNRPETIPQVRPKLSANLINGPLMKSITSAPRMGAIAIECRLHPYGVYIQEMLQSIEEQWNQLAIGSINYLQRDLLPGQITLRFKLEATGNISNLSRLDDEGYSLAAELCRQAIASRVPFGEWTDKMIKDFGQSDEITLNFQYR